ncbi:hypothetical protein TELCIR_03628 [Teladorsagia circumcincta]|uniref:Globin domain-containing protein n=1 Tax=Teladorsagia circumcincta TaxID=45464 RepID=A0A2G9UVS8_TELCI|nr:hypothetical protein TELCIR_03628 [Teladorsagia circumcincta]
MGGSKLCGVHVFFNINPLFGNSEGITISKNTNTGRFERTLGEKIAADSVTNSNYENLAMNWLINVDLAKGTLSSIASLSFSQKQALTASWRLLRPQAPGLFRKIYLELEIVSNKVKQIFYKALCVDAFNKDEENIATMDVHIKLMVKFFDDILASLEDEAECIDRMKRIGMSHAVLARSCGFTSEIWERLGEISMERICAHEIVQTLTTGLRLELHVVLPEKARAWTNM